MRSLFWLALAAAAVFALLLGFWVQIWIDDRYPQNIILVGQRLTVFLLLGTALSLSLVVAAGASILRRPGRSAPATEADSQEPDEIPGGATWQGEGALERAAA